MKHPFRQLALASLIAASPLVSAADRYEFDTAHSSILFFVEHMGLAENQGEFRQWEGTLMIDDKDFAKSSVEVSIDAASIDMDHDKLNAHLRAPDFFNVAEHAKLRFKSTAIATTGENQFTLTGDLSMLGISKPVTLNVSMKKIDAHPFAKRPAIGFHAEGSIKRSDFGLNYAAGAVGDIVKIRIDSETIKAADEAAKP